MSETSNGMPDLSTGDSEPSMEDILASIRKIIADDKTETQLADTDPQVSDIAAEPDVADPVSFSETVEEQQFEIPDVEGTVTDFDELTADFETKSAILPDDDVEDKEILDLINFVNEDEAEPAEAENAQTDTDLPDTSFDESLDLVMDSDASDYYSSSAESDENRMLREEIEKELSADAGTFETDIAPDIESDLLNADVDIAKAPDLDDLLDSEPDQQQDILALDDDFSDDSLTEFEDLDLSDAAKPVEDVEVPDETVYFEESGDIEAAQSDVPGDDQDMDLVKSLLADLMDEDETSEFEDDLGDELEAESFADDVIEDEIASIEEQETASVVEEESVILDETEAENILDEILYQTMEDETAIAEASDDLEAQDESELAEIARTAREAAAAPYPDSATTRAEDKVELPQRNLDKKLNLSAAGGFVGVTAGAAIAGTRGENVETDKALDAQVSQMVEEELELEEIEELLELIEETEAEPAKQADIQEDAEQAALEELVEELGTPQENVEMARAAKKEALVDEDIEQESTEAFAALSHVVQEKAEMEENGPPIGDLVQDALRPMLKEWLDKNLKGIVERAVTKEVKRISSGK